MPGRGSRHDSGLLFCERALDTIPAIKHAAPVHELSAAASSYADTGIQPVRQCYLFSWWCMRTHGRYRHALRRAGTAVRGRSADHCACAAVRLAARALYSV